ncbi:MAG: hypothetical protein HY744_16045 [Deltaproteobacteria bacterium]|nr:hypothetical protein [Deltaproteobacteria bacterium]
MKYTILVALLAAMALVGCKKEGGGDKPGATGEAPSGATGSTGVKECDEYFQKLKDCKGMPEASKAALEQAAETMRKSIAAAPNDAAKQAMAEGCKQGMAGLTACQ